MVSMGADACPAGPVCSSLADLGRQLDTGPHEPEGAGHVGPADGELELAGLVAAQADSGQVVALDPRLGSVDGSSDRGRWPGAGVADRPTRRNERHEQ